MTLPSNEIEVLTRLQIHHHLHLPSPLPSSRSRILEKEKRTHRNQERVQLPAKQVVGLVAEAEELDETNTPEISMMPLIACYVTVRGT